MYLRTSGRPSCEKRAPNSRMGSGAHREARRSARASRPPVGVEDGGDVAHEDPPERGELDAGLFDGAETVVGQPAQLVQLRGEGLVEIDFECPFHLRQI